MSDQRMTFRELLIRHGFTQSSLSRASGVAQSNLSIYSNYRRRLERSNQLTRLRIADAMGLTLAEFEDILDLKQAKTLSSNKQTENKYKLEKKKSHELTI